jgi:type IV secretion system protein VirB6
MVTIFVDIFENLDSTLNTYTSDVIEAVITDITPVVSVMLTIYMMLWGWLTIRGQINEFVTDGFTRIVRLTIIVAIALNIGHYNGFVGDFLTALPDHLLAITANGAATTTGEYLDNTINEIWAAGWAFKNKSDELSTLGVSDFALTAIALFVWGLGIFLTAIAAFLLILSKMALAVLVSVGPIFIILTMFEATKKFFDAWLGQCFNFILISLLVGGVLRLIIGFTLTEITDLDLLNKDDIEAFDSVSIIGYSLIGIYVLRHVLPIASALGGGIALSTLGAGRSLYNVARGGLNGVKNTPKNVMKGIQSILPKLLQIGCEETTRSLEDN